MRSVLVLPTGEAPPAAQASRCGLGLQVVELHKCNTGTDRTDDDILARHHFRIIGKFYRRLMAEVLTMAGRFSRKVSIG
jgi:hypothetical protein